MSLFETLFGPTGHITWWQECARAVLIFAYGLVMVRCVGRRVFGKWAALDIVVSIIVGSSLSRALTGSAPLPGTLAATTVMMGLHWLLAHLAARWPGWSELLEGRAIALAHAGNGDRSSMVRNAISKADLEEALRQSGVESLADTRLVKLEPSGKITVLKAGTP